MVNINRPFCIRSPSWFIVVVKKTSRNSNVFFFNPLCRVSLIRNKIMKSGIKSIGSYLLYVIS